MRKIIFFISCFFVMMNTSWAISVNCPEVASPEEVIKIHLEEEQFSGLKVKYNFEKEFIYQNIKINTPWKVYYDGIDGFSIGNVTNNDNLSMDINVKVDRDAEINKDYVLDFINIESNDVNYKSVNLDNVSCKVKLLSDINTLDSLIVDGITLNPKFNKNTTYYEGTTKNEKIFIKAIASDSNAKVEGDIGEQILNTGVNTFVIKVISSRGNVKEYKIYVTRMVDKKSNDVTLKSLTLSHGNIDFDKNKFLYSVDVGYDIDNIEVEAIANDSKAKVEIDKLDKLIIGENTINIKVIAEDGTIGNYIIIVNRIDKLSSDASIKSLNIKNYEINFKSNVYEYEVEIDGEDKLDIEVILNNDKAKYKIKGNNNLENNSVIEIEVIAEDGSSKVYKINISKIVVSNSNSINGYIGIIPLVIFIGLIIGIIVVKLLRGKFV